MPFGKKQDETGRTIDFDLVYRDLIAPAIADAGLEPIRADEEKVGGLIHKPMFERLILCDYAIADLTTANANVFYELGIRHATRPFTTLSLFAGDSRLPFDVAALRAIPYFLDGTGELVQPEATIRTLTDRLMEARQPTIDSPVFQLVDGLHHQQVDHAKTDIFRAQADYCRKIKERLARAREQGGEALKTIEAELQPLEDQEAGVVVDLFLSFRAVKEWQAMVDLCARMSRPLAATVMVQEQLAFAYNRLGESGQAEAILVTLIREHGPSSETYGLLGRVYKDLWQQALGNGKDIKARGFLEKAVETYCRGFNSDWRDAYPGINALTLLDIQGKNELKKQQLLPVVRYAVQQRLENRDADYWDYATMLELAILADDRDEAENYLAESLAAVREIWEPETTANNLRMIETARRTRGQDTAWLTAIITELEEAGKDRR